MYRKVSSVLFICTKYTILVASSVKNNHAHTSEAANQLSDCRRTQLYPILNEHLCEVIPHLWLSWPSACMFLEFVPYVLLLD